MQPAVRIIRGDLRTYIELAFAYEDGRPVDISAASTTVVVRLRRPGSAVYVIERQAAKAHDGRAGVAIVTLPRGGGTGVYEADVELDFDGRAKKLYESFTVGIISGSQGAPQ